MTTTKVTTPDVYLRTSGLGMSKGAVLEQWVGHDAKRQYRVQKIKDRKFTLSIREHGLDVPWSTKDYGQFVTYNSARKYLEKWLLFNGKMRKIPITTHYEKRDTLIY